MRTRSPETTWIALESRTRSVTNYKRKSLSRFIRNCARRPRIQKRKPREAPVEFKPSARKDRSFEAPTHLLFVPRVACGRLRNVLGRRGRSGAKPVRDAGYLEHGQQAGRRWLCRPGLCHKARQRKRNPHSKRFN